MPTLKLRRRPKIIRVSAPSAAALIACSAAVPDEVVSAPPASASAASSGAEAVPDEAVSTSNIPMHVKSGKKNDAARTKPARKKRKRKAADHERVLGEDTVDNSGNGNVPDVQEAGTPETGSDGGKATAKAQLKHQQNDAKDNADESVPSSGKKRKRKPGLCL